MAKDYVKRSKPKPRPKNQRRPAKGGGRSAPPAKSFPWLPVLLLVMVAGALGYLIYIIKGAADNRPAQAPAVQTQPPPAPVAPPPAPANPIDQKPIEKWTYIEQLENKEIVVKVPEAEKSTRPYLMQCGSFRSAEQAQQLKAKIAFQGLVAQVRHSSGSAWHRVILGPYDSKRLAEQHKHQLIKAKVVSDCAIWFWEG